MATQRWTIRPLRQRLHIPRQADHPFRFSATTVPKPADQPPSGLGFWGLDPGMAIIHHSKNGDHRALAITGLAAEVMRQWSKVRRIDCDLVFPSRRGKPGIEDFRFHDLRHTFASYLAMSGATLAELAELAEALGHRTLAMVKRYAHLTEGHTMNVIARMTERFMAA